MEELHSDVDCSPEDRHDEELLCMSLYDSIAIMRQEF